MLENNPRVRSWLEVVGEGMTSTPLGPHPRLWCLLPGALERTWNRWVSWCLLVPWGFTGGRPSSLVSMDGVESMSSEALDEAAREEARAAIPLQGPLVPAVLTLLVHKDNVAFLQLYLCLTLGWV